MSGAYAGSGWANEDDYPEYNGYKSKSDRAFDAAHIKAQCPICGKLYYDDCGHGMCVSCKIELDDAGDTGDTGDVGEVFCEICGASEADYGGEPFGVYDFKKIKFMRGAYACPYCVKEHNSIESEDFERPPVEGAYKIPNDVSASEQAEHTKLVTSEPVHAAKDREETKCAGCGKLVRNYVLHVSHVTGGYERYCQECHEQRIKVASILRLPVAKVEHNKHMLAVAGS
jgi:hypothetical protein